MSNYYFYVLQGLDFHNNVKIMAFQCADTVTFFIHTLILIHGTDRALLLPRAEDVGFHPTFCSHIFRLF